MKPTVAAGGVLFGWFGAGVGDRPPIGILETMLAGAIPGAAGEFPHWNARDHALGAGGRRADVVHRSADGIAVAIVGTPAIRDRELHELARDRGLAEAVAVGYRTRGTEVLHELHGGFAVAVIDEHRDEAVLAVDRVGGRFPIAYRLTGSGVVFGSRASEIGAHPATPGDIDPAALYDYLYFHMVPAPATAYRDVCRLLPGELVRVRDGKATTEIWWQPVYKVESGVALDRLEEEFREILRSSVRESAGESEAGCFLSGGTDSSAVVGILGEVTGEPPRTYSIGFAAEGYDEMGFARIAADRYRADHHEYYLEPDELVKLIPMVARSYSGPFGNASAVAAFACARFAARDGVERMLGGDGGDELFAGNERYAEQKVLELYGTVPGVLRRGVLDPFASLDGVVERVPVVSKVRNYIRRARVPMPLRTQAYNLVERHGPDRIFDPGFLESVDTDRPRELQRTVYDGAAADGFLNRMLAMDLRFTLADNDLPKVSRMCENAGVDVEYPLLSDDMIEFSLRLPDRLKLRGLRLRWFWKRALRDFLPEATLRKKKHGMGVPFGLWLGQHDALRELTLESMASLKRRAIIRADFIDDIVERQRSEHAVYYGALMWTLLQLEQWMQAHADRPGERSMAGTSMPR